MREAARIGFLGFGEAGMAFADGLAATAYDIKTDDVGTVDAKRADYFACGVTPAATNSDLCAAAQLILSLVTADRALDAARATAASPIVGKLYLDMNSVAPDTKRQASALIEAAGGRYIDVAVMAPVRPSRCNVPLLMAGRHAEAARGALASAGFSNVRIVPGEVGSASAIKMIRSVMVKGLEALTTECVIAARAAGVLDEVLASLDASPASPSWRERADYNLDRMLVHGLRRAAEMEEVVKTLDALGLDAAMTRGTVAHQRRTGSLGIRAVPAGLEAKLEAIMPPRREDAA